MLPMNQFGSPLTCPVLLRDLVVPDAQHDGDDPVRVENAPEGEARPRVGLAQELQQRGREEAQLEAGLGQLAGQRRGEQQGRRGGGVLGREVADAVACRKERSRHTRVSLHVPTYTMHKK